MKITPKETISRLKRLQLTDEDFRKIHHLKGTKGKNETVASHLKYLASIKKYQGIESNNYIVALKLACLESLEEYGHNRQTAISSCVVKTADTPIVNIEIYRLDIYRLLTLLLADKIIVKDADFQSLGNDNFDNEVNRLLVLVAVVTRQLLRSYSNFENKLCGSFYHNYPVERTTKDLTFKKACSMIVHATDIDIASQDYYYSEAISQKPDEAKHRYYQGIITIIGENKQRAELDFKKFAKYCIQLSKQIRE